MTSSDIFFGFQIVAFSNSLAQTVGFAFYLWGTKHPDMKRILLSTLFFLFILTGAFAQKKTDFKVGIIGFYNLENLFDTEDDPKINDEEFLPEGGRQWTEEKYKEKLGNMASVISEIGTDLNPDGPAILGVAEIENRKVLEDLIQEDAIADRNYGIVHYDSPDWRGIDVAMLYNPKYFTPEHSEPLYVYLPGDTEQDTTFTRDILYVKGNWDGETIHVFVNHWPSRRGGEQVSAPKRNAAAKIVKDKIAEIQKEDSAAKVFIMGDLNDDPVSPSVKKILQAKKNAEGLRSNQIFNPYIPFFKNGIGSNAYRDAWSLFDQIMMTAPALDRSGDGYFYYRAKIHNKKHLLQKTGQYKGYPFRTFSFGEYQGGYSDHFPVYVVLLKKV